MEMKQVYENANERMHKTIRALNGEYDSIRAGRANASVLDKIQGLLWGADPGQPDGGNFRGGSTDSDHPAVGCFHPARH